MIERRRSKRRVIACIRIPDFPVQAERARRTELRGRPFVITSTTSIGAGCVIGCSAEGRAVGLREGMPVREVRSVCKEAALLAPDPDYYETVHVRFVDALEAWAPAVEEGELGAAYTDLTGMERLYPRTEALLQALKEAAAVASGRLTVGVGAGPNKFVASIVAHLATVRRVRASEAADFLAPQPARLLPLSPEMHRRLALFGLCRIGEIARIDPDALVAQFGKEGRVAWELANGIDRAPLRPRRPFRPILESLSFPSPVVEWARLWAGIQQLATRIWHRPERGGATVRQVELVVGLAEERWERRITFSEPVGDRQRFETMLKRRLGELSLPSAAHALTLKLSVLGGAYVGQERLFNERAERMQRIKEAFVRIKARWGATGLYSVTEVEPWSRIPERRYALISFDP